MLIASIAALAAAGGALTAILLLNRPETPEGTDSTISDAAEAQETILLNPGTAEDLEEVHIRNTSDFTVYAQSGEDGTAVYRIRGFEDLPVDNSLLSTLAGNGSSLSADSLVEENAADLSKYGLEEPAAEVTFSYKDAEEFTLRIGSTVPMDTSMTYCEAGGNVYLVKSSLMTNYQKEDLYFLSKTILEKPADEDMPIVESLRLERKDLDYDMYMEYAYKEKDEDSVGGSAAAHIMTEPIWAYLNVDNSADVTNGMFGLTAAKAVKGLPEEADLKEAGLDDPFCTVTMKCDDGSTYVLYFGDTFTDDAGTYYYACMKGGNVLYAVAEDKAIWATVQAEEITSSNMFATYVWNIAQLDVQAGAQSLHFTGSGSDQESYEVTKNGEECDTERFRQFYRFILGIYGETLCIGEELPEGEPDASIHVKTQDGQEDYTVTFYKQDNLKTIVAMNGLPSYIIRSSCLDAMVHNMEIFDNAEEEFSLTWQ